MSSNIQRDEGAGFVGEITVSLFDVATLESRYSNWSQLPKDRRLELLKADGDRPDPYRVIEQENLILNSFLEQFAAGETDLPLLALGDSAVTPDETNTELNSEVWRTAVGQDEPSGSVRLTSTLLSQNEANGESIVEIGFHDGTRLLTHAILSPGERIDEKTASDTATIDYSIRHERAD